MRTYRAETMERPGIDEIVVVLDAALDAARLNFEQAPDEATLAEFRSSLARATLMRTIYELAVSSPILKLRGGGAPDQTLLHYATKILISLVLAEIGIEEIAAMIENDNPDDPLTGSSKHDPFDLNHVCRICEQAGVDAVGVQTLHTLVANLLTTLWDDNANRRTAILEYWTENDHTMGALYERVLQDRGPMAGAVDETVTALRAGDYRLEVIGG